ncbi:MTH938/NDUFAF3 family protein [Methylophilus sp. VKM B-3414]|uniref:Mth938-like domain-containing protein n=1 Tax=Methylophilus sp. VKM B-3414 TaxID=3076121 RepID=UPI0028CAC62F|nr:MTH938/NDUFAF3 family protein [Methylophilus sp. VKM B-3414]MDT7850120.1 MTH938/NDUFAF3 family protein [Methylophilus sp. VKM B-3414]
MKLHLHTGEQQYQIHGVDSDAVTINQQCYPQPVIVSDQALRTDWFHGPWEKLDAQALSVILEFKPEVVLLGTGDKQRFIHPKHLQPFLSELIAVECMTTAAACRTFNILSAENRKVVAALLLEKHLSDAS